MNASYYITRRSPTIRRDSAKLCVCVFEERDCLIWSKIFRNAIFLPSDNIRPKSVSIGYIIGCTFDNHFKPCNHLFLGWQHFANPRSTFSPCQVTLPFKGFPTGDSTFKSLFYLRQDKAEGEKINTEQN